MPTLSLTPPAAVPASSDTPIPAMGALGVRNPTAIQDTLSSLRFQNTSANEVKRGPQRKSWG